MSGKYEFFPAEHSGYARSEVTREGLDTIKTSGLDTYDKINAVLTIAGYKDGAELQYTAPTSNADITDETYDLVAALIEMGVTCLVYEDELTFDDPGLDSPIARQEYRILATRDCTYGTQELIKIQEEREDTVRIFPEFLGYPEDDVDAYIEQAETPSHLQDQSQVLTPYTAARKHGLSQAEMETLIGTTFHMVTDDPATLQTRLHTAETRQQVIEAITAAYDVDFISTMDAHAAQTRKSHEKYHT